MNFSKALIRLTICIAFISCRHQSDPPAAQIKKNILAQVDSFEYAVDQFTRLTSGSEWQTRIQPAFLELRDTYKKMEWATEYFTPTNSRLINGAPVVEVEPASGWSFKPAGMQVMEADIFPEINTSKRASLLEQLNLLKEQCQEVRSYHTHVPLADWQVFDACKQEVFRILTLGITGYDNPLTLHSMAESATALQAVQATMAHYSVQGISHQLDSQFTVAIRYLRSHPDFNQFDRAIFISAFGNPLSSIISQLHDSLHIPLVKYNRLLRQDAQTLFDSSAFDVNAYSPGHNFNYSKAKAMLGKKLFNEPLLSGSGTRSCGSCHRPENAYTDGLVKNTTINGKKLLLRNTPTLLNAALQPYLFYDLRAITLEDQLQDVIHNPDEMHSTLRQASKKLWALPSYRKLFLEVFPSKNRSGIDSMEIANALASYLRSLTLLNSRFDDYMRGNKKAMNQQEVKGFNLFMGKAKCATCHFMPLFNGTFPPKYYQTEVEVLGVPSAIHNKTIDPDSGWYRIIPVPDYLHGFKTTSVRNAAKTAPYMHNGVFPTLQDVMEFYNDGGGSGQGVHVPNQSLAPDSLHLSQPEIDQIIAFIGSLDSRE